jgi:hypothetical protein
LIFNIKNILKFQVILCLIFLTDSSAQQLNITNNSWFYPTESETWTTDHLIILSLAKLPEEIIENKEIFKAPLFSYKARLGLPLNFHLSGGIESNIITYHFEAGLRWNYILNDLSFSPGFYISYWLGRLKQEGFDSKITGTNFYPGLNIGYSFKKFTVTIAGELLYQVNTSKKNGDVTVSRELRKYNGTSIGVYVEQPLWKENYLIIGFRSLFLKLYYPSWAAFNAFDRRLHITEAMVGLIL